MTDSRLGKVYKSKYGRTEDSDYYSEGIYLGPPFQEYVVSKYLIENKNNIYRNQKLLLLLYAYEWFNYKPNDFKSKMTFHPYLLTKDFNILQNQVSKFKTLNAFSFIISYSTAFVLLLSRNKKNLNQTSLIIAMKCLPLSLGLTMLVYIYNKKQLNNFIEKNFNQYLSLSINKKMIKSELMKQGIKISEFEDLLDNKTENFLNEFLGSGSSKVKL